MNAEHTSAQANAKLYQTLDSAISAIDSHKLHDVCRVIANNFQFYILVDNADGDKFWHPFDGVHVKEAIMANEAFKEGQRKYRENPLSAQDVEDMRNVMTAIATLAVLFEYKDEEVIALTDHAIVRLAFNLYKRDEKKDESFKFTDIKSEDNPKIGAYVTKVAFAFEAYQQMVDKVKASVDEAKTDVNKLPEDDNGTVNKA